MFDDFNQSSTNRQARKRFGSSMAAAVVIYGTSSAAIIAATATARTVVEEELKQVEFAPPPEPEPEPEPEPPPPEPEPKPQKQKPKPRPKVKRDKLEPPKEVPKEKLKESDAELAEAGEVGPVDGFLDGVEGGTGTAKPEPPPPPPPKPEPVVRARAYPGNEPKPDYPKSALRRGVEGSVDVSFVVMENGTCGQIKILRGPEEFHRAVIDLVRSWRFHPAKRGDTPIRQRMVKRVTFRLEDA